MPFQQHEQTGLVWFTADVLNDVPHGFSTRKGGVSPAPWDSLNLRPEQGDGPEKLRENYRRFFAALGLDETRAVLSQQTHTANIRPVTAEDAGKGLLRPRDYSDVDALITNVPNLSLTVFSADCGTVLLCDPVHQAIGAIHAGWRGCAAGIVGKTVAMQAALGADADAYITVKGPKFHVDLAGLNRQWLLRAGLLPERIEVSGICTACRPDLFWSHRKMGDQRGVQVAVISLKEGL